MGRIVIEEPCEHGEMKRHSFGNHAGGWHWEHCPGGSRRVLDPGSYVLIEKVDGEWPSTPEWPRTQGDGPLVDALNRYLLIAWAKDGIGPLRDVNLSSFEKSTSIVHAFLGAAADALAGGEQP